MNNLATSLAQQQTNAPFDSHQPPVARAELVSNARAWALKALKLASEIAPPNRNEDCDVGCAVATHNLGEFAEMDGDIQEARRRYSEAEGLAKAIDFQEGVKNAREGLKRVSGYSR